MGARKNNSVTELAMRTIQERVAKMLEKKGRTINSIFDDKSQARKVYSQVGCKSAMTVDTLWQILEAFPEVSAEWILRGVGDMNQQPKSVSTKNTINIGDNNVTSTENSQIHISDADEKLKEENKQLQIQLAEAKAKLSILEPMFNKQLGLK